jgi:hypothetical protein
VWSAILIAWIGELEPYRIIFVQRAFMGAMEGILMGIGVLGGGKRGTQNTVTSWDEEPGHNWYTTDTYIW